ncbi:MAG TPA: phosphopentomutase [Bacilli bacterium]|jgi:phosphopentomutase|nr:phosphopentomutase [Erysipelotrichaceae bacterium]HNY74211.1 phosphopentomutase [Bacilli bacterium]HQC32826.1 phosphopentomutase [Bacilli bacterium]
MNKYKRMFVIVIDSVGIGEMPDAEKFGDKGANTLVHTAREAGGLKVPVMNSLGLGDLAPILGTTIVKHPHSYALRLRETSAGKDTMTGHWEMMGINTTKPFQTFTDTGFPQSLIDELAEKTGHKIIGNKAASGTEILVELGEQQMRENSLIVYTSADSVLQIAAHEEVTGVKELYRCCDIAREICMKPEYFVGRIIARPFIGTNKHNFKRTANRHDLAVSPTGTTTLDVLKNNGFMVSSIGKINDIFNTMGVVKAQKTVSNLDGMNKTIEEAKNHDFTGLCYVNLVEFDSEFGHRRNAIGYAKALEEFDVKLGELLKVLKDDDLVMVTADHGNDPVHHGTDHTREKVPLLIYSKSINNGRYLDERETFAVIGASVLENFGLKKTPNQIGAPIMEIFE